MLGFTGYPREMIVSGAARLAEVIHAGDARETRGAFTGTRDINSDVTKFCNAGFDTSGLVGGRGGYWLLSRRLTPVCSAVA